MLKAATLLLSFFIGRMNPSGAGSIFSPEEIIENATDQFVAKLKGVMGQFALGAVGLTLLLAGFLVAYFHLLDQWDVTDIVVIDAVFAGGITLAVLGIILFGVAVKLPQKTNAAIEQSKESRSSFRGAHPLEEAISAFILDHVKEREFSREQRRAEMQDFQQRNSFQRSDSSKKSDAASAHVH